MKIEEIDAFVFDFDGVLTNNIVYIDQDGKEMVACSRSDGLAFDVLNKINKPSYIVSTEKNPVVTARAKKLKIVAYQNVENKIIAVQDIIDKHSYDVNKICFVGNDLNDYSVMQYCGFTVCPSDSHSSIREIADIVLNAKGGDGVVRELIEKHFGISFLKILYR